MIATVFYKKFGSRVVLVSGALVISLSYVLLAFSEVIWRIFLIGLIGAISNGLSYIISVLIVPEYFDEFRGVATGISMAGSGININ